ncbi:hypothetical protein NLG97_g5746 [Lecanicillium saksenae]|uniref:Uncharacterized protein n=1 Tax=Lecanicillium saksenae TaxID=468837 RepID=A0ACC1QUT2_9HYPO|nr:hypothetical protein NLG97_g5746 [Lecanicillium saksenae]
MDAAPTESGGGRCGPPATEPQPWRRAATRLYYPQQLTVHRPVMAATKPKNRAEFRIAIICALPREADPVTLLFDEFWDDDGDVFGRAKGDTNTYITGRLGIHDVVLVTAPAMGTANAASTATCLRLSFPEVKLALLIGVCGGIPKVDGRDVFLGDVVISRTLFQFDYGRQYPGYFAVKKSVDDSLGRANKEIRSLLASVEMEFGRRRLETRAQFHLKSLQEAAIREGRRAKYFYPGMSKDRLYMPTYRHQHQTSCASCCSGSSPICEVATKAACEDLGCSDAYLVKRVRPGGDGDNLALYIGHLGSGNTVMKSGQDRDRMSAEHGIIAFEMEGAGAWDEIPCIVVKGICDFSDSHKNKVWQDYAAATAAAVSKALLERYTRDDGSRNDAEAQGKPQPEMRPEPTLARRPPRPKRASQKTTRVSGMVAGNDARMVVNGENVDATDFKAGDRAVFVFGENADKVLAVLPEPSTSHWDEEDEDSTSQETEESEDGGVVMVSSSVGRSRTYA